MGTHYIINNIIQHNLSMEKLNHYSLLMKWGKGWRMLSFFLFLFIYNSIFKHSEKPQAHFRLLFTDFSSAFYTLQLFEMFLIHPTSLSYGYQTFYLRVCSLVCKTNCNLKTFMSFVIRLLNFLCFYGFFFMTSFLLLCIYD